MALGSTNSKAFLDQSPPGTTPLTLKASSTFGEVPSPDAGPLGTFALLGLTPQGSAALTVTLRASTLTMLPPALSFAFMPDPPGASDPIRNLFDEGELVVGLRRAIDLGRVQRRGKRLHLRGRRARGRRRRRASFGSGSGGRSGLSGAGRR